VQHIFLCYSSTTTYSLKKQLGFDYIGVTETFFIFPTNYIESAAAAAAAAAAA
jgi:hypothetical protein